MALSTVTVQAPTFAGDYLLRWCQPFSEGEDSTDWYVNVGGSPRKVQREKLVHEDVYTCCVPVAAGTTSIAIEQGSQTSPSTAWTAPTITGFGFQLQGQDGSVSQAMLDGSDGATVTRTRRDGFWRRTVERWVHCKVVSGGSSPIGTPSLGVRAYLHYRSDCGTDILLVDVELSNASATVGSNGYGLGTDAYGDAYFSYCTWLLPTGWAVLENRPLVTTGQHMFPWRMATVRRLALYRTAVSGAGTKAAELLAQYGLGFASSGASYHTRKAYGPQKTVMPDLDSANVGYVGGFAAAKASAQSQYNALFTTIQAGTANAARRIYATRMGLFHPYGQTDPQETGGAEIGVFSGMERCRESILAHALLGDAKIDGSGVFLYNRSTGKPLRTRDFGAAYTTTGISGYSSDAQYLGRQPFSDYIQNNSGYDIATKDTWLFPQRNMSHWPPYTVDSRATLPDGTSNPSFDKYIPSSSPGSPPFSMNTGTCPYESQASGNSLVTRWVPHTSFAGYYSGFRLGHRDADDEQHVSRLTYFLKPLVWLADDLVARDWIEQLAEWAAFAWSEIGHLPYTSYTPYNQRSLLYFHQQVNAAPHTAAAYIGRGGGWVADLFATQFALSSESERDGGYANTPSSGIRRRTEMMHEVIFKTSMSNGATYRLTQAQASVSGQLTEMFTAPTHGLYGVGESALDPGDSGMQVGLEMPLAMHGLWALMKQLGTTQGEEYIRAAFAQHTSLTGLYTNYFSNPAEMGPMKYAAVWDNATSQPIDGQSADRVYSGLGNPGHPNHTVILEYAYRVDGLQLPFDVSKDLGFPAPRGTTNTQQAARLVASTDEWRFGGGFIGFLAGQAGPDSSVPTFEGSTTAYLRVFKANGTSYALCPVDDATGRMPVYNSSGTAVLITNSPDARPENDGKFPVYDADGNVVLVDFFLRTSDTPSGDDPPTDVEPGVKVGQGRAQGGGARAVLVQGGV